MNEINICRRDGAWIPERIIRKQLLNFDESIFLMYPPDPFDMYYVLGRFGKKI